MTPIGEGGVSVHAMAPWARRRGRLVQLALVGSSLVLGAAFLATLSGTSSFAGGVVLAVAIVAVGAGAALYLRRTVPRVRLEFDDAGVTYEAGRHRIRAAWDDVAAVDLVLRGTETGPALVLREDRAVSGSGLLGMGDIGGAVAGMGVASASMRSTIPLAAFIEGRFVGSPVEADLRQHIPSLVDGYVLRHPDRVR
jgi:hypothetical protein